MANLSSAFQDALADQSKAALVAIIAKNPGTTVRDLKQLVSDNPMLGSITLGGLLGVGGVARGRGGRPKGSGSNVAAAAAAAPGAAAAGAAPRKAGKPGPRKGAAHKRNVRTETGREALDKEVLEALTAHGGEAVAATQLRQSLNADPTQLRTSLNRLIERGLVTFTGKARGTRYSLS
ncbi:winged helix DNA-binding protein [Enhygromyxa salina]|uniref:MarR family protein n=1 Tax=Enhygromyxa salina TaxID=215803 RepID=A0A2S9XPY2_9BACT|nr:winged helix DNA-binding protein [Enhygromyxa salina]PRP94922.1 MarR family protein [Enhygromyxa salina]